MQEVYRYCHTRDIPILMHCSNGGFYADEAFRKNSEPKLWKPILKKYKGLKICFGHFGGAESLCGADIEPNSWTQQVLELMENPENKGVYADISFHSEPMKNKEATFFDTIMDTALQCVGLSKNKLVIA